MLIDSEILHKKSILQGRKYFKPFDYPEFYIRWKNHERSHWLPTEISLYDDVNDWNNNLSDSQKNFLTHLFRFFTQGDIDVGGAYCTEYLPYLSKNPEIAMFLSSVVAREAVHVDAYSYLQETLGMPDIVYRQFLDYKEICEKQSYLKKYQRNYYGILENLNILFYILFAFLILGYSTLFIMKFSLIYFMLYTYFSFIITGRIYNYMQYNVKFHIASGIALFSGFTEGMQLFSSFTMLLAFPMNGLMKGMGQIITWSIADETQHTDGMISLFKIFREEYSTCKCSRKIKLFFGCSCLNLESLKLAIFDIANEMVRLEDGFIDLAFSEYSKENNFMGIEKDDLKKYIRFIADKRLNTMGYEKIFHIKNNPLPQFEVMINAPSQINFFENKSTDYAKTDLDWGKIWKYNKKNI